MRFYSSCCLPVIIKWIKHPSVVWKSALFINHSAQFVTRGDLNEHFRHIYKNLRPGTGVILSVYLVISTDRGLISKILSFSYFILHSIWSKQVYFSLHMLWILHRVNFIYLKQAIFVRKVFTWGVNGTCLSLSLGYFSSPFSWFLPLQHLPHPQHSTALLHFWFA